MNNGYAIVFIEKKTLWIPFEPTPGYVEKRYKEWVPVNKNISSTNQSNDYSDQYKHMNNTDNTPELDEAIAKQDRKINFNYVIIILAIFASMFVLATIYYTCTTVKMRKRYAKSNLSVKAIAIYRTIMFYLEYIGYPYNCSETLCIYTTRMDVNIKLEGQSLKLVNDLYMAIHYGDYNITNEELNKMREYEQVLYQHLIKTYGRMKMSRCTRRLTLSYKKLFS